MRIDDLAKKIKDFLDGRVSREDLLREARAQMSNPVMEELLNTISEGGSPEHLQHLAECVSGARDFSESKFVQRAHDQYFFMEPFLRDYFEGKASLHPAIKQGLSPRNPVDLLILDAIDLMEKGASDKSGIALGLADKEIRDPKAYAKAVLDVIDGKRGYRVFTVCSEGNTYSSVRLT